MEPRRASSRTRWRVYLCPSESDDGRAHLADCIRTVGKWHDASKLDSPLVFCCSRSTTVGSPARALHVWKIGVDVVRVTPPYHILYKLTCLLLSVSTWGLVSRSRSGSSPWRPPGRQAYARSLPVIGPVMDAINTCPSGVHGLQTRSRSPSFSFPSSTWPRTCMLSPGC